MFPTQQPFKKKIW